MDRVIRVSSCLLVAAVGVAPPAVVPPAVLPAALPLGAGVAQVPGANVGNVAPTIANPAAIPQPGQRLRGQPSIASLPSGLEQAQGAASMESLMSSSLADTARLEAQAALPNAPTAPSAGWAHGFGALVLAAVVGATVGGLWSRAAFVREKLAKARQLDSQVATEMIWSEPPKVAVAALASEAAFAGEASISSRAPASPRSVACNAAAVKKKGVKVVHGTEIPWNLFSPKAPYAGKVVKNDVHPQTLTSDTGDANWETCHVTFNHDGKVPYVEGQSIGIVAPGPDKKGQTPAKIRLYSIASSAVGDDETSKTVSLCVKRVVELDGKHVNREVGEDKPDKAGTGFPDNKVYRGVCSNHICDMSEGDEVLITGPTGAEMLLPTDQSSNIIMLATGTGIAPMRSYLRLLFKDKAGANADGSRKFTGLAWLFMGVPYSKSLLYDDEHTDYKEKYPDQFRYDYAVSREDKNAAGQKMYIQTKMAEYKEELWELMQKENTHIYMCGLKGMEAGMEECFSEIAEKNGLVWKEFAKSMKKADRYHVEVY